MSKRVAMRRQIRTIKRTLKRLLEGYLRWKSEDRKAERALVRKLRALRRSLWNRGLKK
jgi:hypothetical protein